MFGGSADDLRQRRLVFALALVGDLIGVAILVAVDLDPWVVALAAAALLLPTLSMLAMTTVRLRAAERPSSEAERLGRSELVPGRDRRS